MPQKLTGNTKPSTRPRVRNACFTLNNPTVHCDAFTKDLVDSNLVQYICVGNEVGASGTPHFQGYIEFQHQLDFAAAQQLLDKAHIEPRRGTAQQAADYCKKDGEFTEWGTLSKQGQRTDVDEMVAMVQEGASTFEIATALPAQYVKYHKGIMALQAALIEPRVTAPEVRVWYGGTGTGKSFKAREWLPDAYVWHPQQGTWFDGYRGQKSVVFEEFRGQIPFGMLLSLLDRYCCKVQYKGGVCEFAAVQIAITSPVEPARWYLCLDENDRLDQLTRRLTEVEELKSRFLAGPCGS